MADATALLQLNHVSKRYDSLQSAEHLEILRDISFALRQAESIAIIGPSGSGKSTLLNIIGTLDRPSSGEVFLDGKDLAQLADRELAHVRNHKIGLIFQAHHLLPQCTVLENVLLPTLADKSAPAKETYQDRASRLLSRVGLNQRLHHRPGQLSGGERQRVAVVRALIMQPKLLLADEPTGALDRANSEEMAQLLAELNREEQVTLILVTHALELAKRMERVYELREGKLLQS
ncbi:MAG TPA: ABC transporter ATP-binding protein [Verrucomicrobiae bacterium]|jgi:ABC-type lipoprotein export system ATPase subunit